MFCRSRYAKKNTYESLHSDSAPWSMATRYRGIFLRNSLFFWQFCR